MEVALEVVEEEAVLEVVEVEGCTNVIFATQPTVTRVTSNNIS